MQETQYEPPVAKNPTVSDIHQFVENAKRHLLDPQREEIEGERVQCCRAQRSPRQGEMPRDKMGGSSDEFSEAAQRPRRSLTISALLASAALNAVCLTLLMHEEMGSVHAPHASALVQTVPMMEAVIRQRARPAEEHLRRMQARASAAVLQKKSSAAKALRSKGLRGRNTATAPRAGRRSTAKGGRFNLQTLHKEMTRDQRLDHSGAKPSANLEGVQQLSGVHAEAQFNWEGTTFGHLEPRLANATEPAKEAEDGDAAPEFIKDAPPAALSFTGKDCSPTEIIGGTGVPNPYDAVFPKELNQITIEAWVKDCNLIDFNGYVGLHDVRSAPVGLPPLSGC